MENVSKSRQFFREFNKDEDLYWACALLGTCLVALYVLYWLLFSLTLSNQYYYCHYLKDTKEKSILMVAIIHLPLSNHFHPMQDFMSLCYMYNKVKWLNFIISKNDQIFYPLIQWDSLVLLSNIMLLHGASFSSQGILFQKLSWYNQQNLMIVCQHH